MSVRQPTDRDGLTVFFRHADPCALPEPTLPGRASPTRQITNAQRSRTISPLRIVLEPHAIGLPNKDILHPPPRPHAVRPMRSPPWPRPVVFRAAPHSLYSLATLEAQDSS